MLGQKTRARSGQHSAGAAATTRRVTQRCARCARRGTFPCTWVCLLELTHLDAPAVGWMLHGPPQGQHANRLTRRRRRNAPAQQSIESPSARPWAPVLVKEATFCVGVLCARDVTDQLCVIPYCCCRSGQAQGAQSAESQGHARRSTHGRTGTVLAKAELCCWRTLVAGAVLCHDRSGNRTYDWQIGVLATSTWFKTTRKH